MSRIKTGSLIGIDVGGTFTDCVLVQADGSTVVEKTFTTPEDPSKGVLDGLEKLASKTGLPIKDFLAAVIRIVHGTTITTNAVLTGRGAKTGFITTEGFRDVLLMRRGVREDQFNSKCAPPAPLVPRHLSYTVAERVDCEGRENVPLDRQGAREVIGALKRTRRRIGGGQFSLFVLESGARARSRRNSQRRFSHRLCFVVDRGVAAAARL